MWTLGALETPVLAGAGALFAVNITFATVLLRGYVQRERQHNVDELSRRSLHATENQELRKQLYVANWKINVLVYAMQRAGIAVPEVIWERNGDSVAEQVEKGQDEHD